MKRRTRIGGRGGGSGQTVVIAKFVITGFSRRRGDSGGLRNGTWESQDKGEGRDENYVTMSAPHDMDNGIL